MTHLKLNVSIENWPIAGAFTISRGAKREARVVIATLADGRYRGRGECVPYTRYGETVESVKEAVLSMSDALEHGMTRNQLLNTMPPGAARNAIDCALWDYESKAQDTSAAALAGLNKLSAKTTAYTISLADPDVMAVNAANAANYPVLKLKLGGDGDAERLHAVREAVPTACLIADANEAWKPQMFETLMTAALGAKIELIEQPLPVKDDALLAEISRDIPICADESAHHRADLPQIARRYDVVNIKLDKAGGLTEALALAEEARALGLKIMVGCMVATSLSMAPAMILAQHADWVDLDGPLLLSKDREPGLRYQGAMITPPERELWG